MTTISANTGFAIITVAVATATTRLIPWLPLLLFLGLIAHPFGAMFDVGVSCPAGSGFGRNECLDHSMNPRKAQTLGLQYSRRVSRSAVFFRCFSRVTRGFQPRSARLILTSHPSGLLSRGSAASAPGNYVAAPIQPAHHLVPAATRNAGVDGRRADRLVPQEVGHVLEPEALLEGMHGD